MADNDVFHIFARGVQSWEHVTIELVDGRIVMEVDGTQMNFTLIQTQELVYWLVTGLREDQSVQEGLEVPRDSGL